MKLQTKPNKVQETSDTLETPQTDTPVERDKHARMMRRSERSMKIKSGVKAGRALMLCD